MRWVRQIGVLIVLATGVLPTAVRAQVCGMKNLCGQMNTCAEARHYLTVCGVKRLDADNDGIPCETVCGKTLDVMNARIVAQPFSAPLARSLSPTEPSIAGNLLIGTAQAASPKSTLAEDPEPAGFQCGSKRTCKEMTSCSEAKFYLNQCGVKRLDGDSDGIPCNGLCVR